MQSSEEQQGEITKPYLSDQCKEIEENNKMERLEISSRKLEIPRECFMMGLIKDRNGMDLIEAEDIKKRWQKYTEELYKNRASRPR